MLVISVGQDYHENCKLNATIDLINRSGFKHCDVVLADTLQRYNHYMTISKDKSLLLVKKKGDDWLVRNKATLAHLDIPHTVKRWDEFIKDEEFAPKRLKVLYVYEQDDLYKAAIQSNVKKYLERTKVRDSSILQDKQSLFSYGLEYSIEECTVAMLLWPSMGYDYVIYPKPMTDGMKYTRDLFVTGLCEHKCQWLSLRFRTKKSPINHSFGE